MLACSPDPAWLLNGLVADAARASSGREIWREMERASNGPCQGKPLPRVTEGARIGEILLIADYL